MLFTDNFVHGDLHPGNIFVTRDGELALLDAGIALRYTEAPQPCLARFVLALQEVGTK